MASSHAFLIRDVLQRNKPLPVCGLVFFSSRPTVSNLLSSPKSFVGDPVSKGISLHEKKDKGVLMIDLLILGCGYVGTAVGKEFVQQGKSVVGVVRSDKRLGALKEVGVEPLLLDLRQSKVIEELPEARWVLICPSAGGQDVELYQAVYVDLVRNFLDNYLFISSIEKCVYTSSTGVYSQCHGEWVDEDTYPQPLTERAKILLHAEQQLLQSSVPSIIFRLSGIYGPNRSRISSIQSGEVSLEGKERFGNMIHLEDIVQGVRLLFEKGSSGETYLGGDDAPFKQAEFYGWLIDRLNLKQAEFHFGNNSPEGKRCSNKKIKALGFKPKYPTFREGYESFLK